MSKENIIISIIVPVYNAEKYLSNCLDSIINQYYTNLEIIVVDDGSTDNSYSICKKYAARDERIRFFHQDNKGLVCTRRFGIEQASGDYITFVDADDYLDLDAYSKVLSKMETFADIIIFGLVENYKDHIVIKKNKYQSGIYNRQRLKTEIFPSMLSNHTFFDFGILPNLVCKMIKKDFIDICDLHINDIISVGEDADVTFQLMVQAQSLEIVDCYSYHYCKRDDSMMCQVLGTEAIDALEMDLRRGFMKVGLYEIMEKQLQDYIIFIKLLKNPRSIKCVNERFSNGDKVIALYGAGGYGQALYGQYRSNIFLWADREYQKYLDKGFPVISVNDLIEKQDLYDLIYIAILNTEQCERIKNDLLKKGIKKEIIYYHNEN